MIYLKKILKILGLPSDVIHLKSEWLKERFYNVDINGTTSTLFDLLLGTVQGSVLGPILCAIFVSPLFEISDLTSFADDTYNPI